VQDLQRQAKAVLDLLVRVLWALSAGLLARMEVGLKVPLAMPRNSGMPSLLNNPSLVQLEKCKSKTRMMNTMINKRLHRVRVPASRPKHREMINSQKFL